MQVYNTTDDNTVLCDKRHNAHTTQATQLFKVTKLTRNTIIFTLKTIHPARSAINCDVYVGGKVGVAKSMMFQNLKLKWF